MSRTVLITDVHTPLGDQLLRRYLGEGYPVAATRCKEAVIRTPVVSEEEQLLLIDWNRSSAISAKNVLLAALNRYERIDETLILSPPELEQKLLQETPAQTIEREVDTWIKGTLFLTHTVLLQYAQQHGGCLALVNHTPREESTVPAPLENALRGSFAALAGSILAGTALENVFVNGFESRTQKIEELADFIFDNMKSRGAKSSGKWHRFPARSGFLSALNR